MSKFWTTDPPEIAEDGTVIRGGMWPKQAEWWELPNYVRMFIGGYGCVSGDTPINGIPIAERFSSSVVETLQGPAIGSPGYLKGQAGLYRVTTELGKSVAVTLAHRFLTPFGWRPLHNLAVGDVIAGGSMKDDLHSSSMRSDSEGSCFWSASSRAASPAQVAVSCNSSVWNQTASPTQPPVMPTWEVITGVEFVRFGDFYDISVPGPEHYLAEGLWHHNSGKTRTLCKRAIALSLHNSPAPVALVSPTYAMASETVITTTEELLEGKRSLLPSLKWSQIRKAPHTFTIRYAGRTGRILVYSGEDPRKLKGPNIGAVGIDEPFIQEQEVFTQMVARCRHPLAKRREINLTGTPENLGYGYELAEGSLGKKLDVGVVQASTRDNLSLPTDYVEYLSASLDEKTAKAFIEGQFVNLVAGIVLYNFNRMDHVVDFPMPPAAELGCGMDFNVNPMASGVFWHDQETRHIHFFDEIELPNSDTDDMCSELAKMYWEPGVASVFCDKKVMYRTTDGLRKVYPDASGRYRSTSAPAGASDYTFIKSKGFTIIARDKNPPRRDRFNAANARFRMMKITVAPWCKKMIRYFSQYSYEQMSKQESMSHLFDACTYPISMLYPLDRNHLNTARLRGI